MSVSPTNPSPVKESPLAEPEAAETADDVGEATPANENTETEDVAEPIEEEQWHPSRSYQAMLLVAGFTMIFHVIGINSIYGIFQASFKPRCFRLVTVVHLTSFQRNSTPRTQVISATRKARTLWSRLWVPSVLG